MPRKGEVTVTVVGLLELRRKLGLLDKEIERAARLEIKKALVAIERGAKERAPVETGRLRNSITHEEDTVAIGGRVGTNVHYAPYLEFGTHKMPAQPFLFPALEAERRAFLMSLVRRVNLAGQKVARQ